MNVQQRIALTPVASAVAAALCPGQSAVAQETAATTDLLDEVVVTARKRTESAQDIPSAIQAISQTSLAAMGAKGMEDYSRFVPSINVVSYGASSSTVVFRGAITGSTFIGQATSSVYLDEISVTQTGSQPNIRPVDIARVEALSGPQGTLYGSDAQAGTLRIITNQPVMDEYEAVFDSELRGGSKSDVSYRSSLVLNVPLLEDKLAMRVVGYKDHDGGFVDNVPGRTADSYGLAGVNKAPAQFGTLDNSKSVEDRWNDADVWGARIHALWNINDNWSATLSYHHQTTDSGADNYFDPYVGDLQVVRFHDEWREEKFDMGSLKIDGDLGFAQLVAAVSYYERSARTQRDITTYAHYWAAQYCHDSAYTSADAPYYWTNPETGYTVVHPVYCQGPTVDADFFNRGTGRSLDDKLTAEIRLSREGEMFDWIVGVYREESGNGVLAGTPFAAPTTGGDGNTLTYQQSASLQYWEWYWSNVYGEPTTYPDATAHWYSGGHTDWEQSAVFGEATWHINDKWDLTVGGRYFDRSNTRRNYVNHPGGPNFAGEPDTTSGDRDYRLAHNGQPEPISGGETQFSPKVSLSYALDDDKMVYALYSRGLRQGGVNNIRGQPFFPKVYESDIMDNYEVGYKATFGGGRGRFNLTAYNMVWDKYQLGLVDPTDPPCEVNGVPDFELSIPGVCGQPYQNLIANAGNAHINGANADFNYLLGENWLIGLNYEIMEAETDTEQDLTGDGIPDLVSGLRLPLVPSSKGAGWVEYRQPVELFGGTEFVVRTQWSYTGDSLNILDPRGLDDPNPQFKSPSYVIGDLRFGIIANDWQVDLFVNNLTDERGLYTTGTGEFEWAAAQTVEGREHHRTLYTVRPREVGLRFTKRWGG